jgi:hypothetical protein
MAVLREGSIDMLPLIYDVLAALGLFVVVCLVTISFPEIIWPHVTG